MFFRRDGERSATIRCAALEQHCSGMTRAGRGAGDEGRSLPRTKKKPHAVLQHEADILYGVTNGIFFKL